MSKKSTKRTIFASVMLIICVALLVAMFTSRCSQEDASLESRARLGFYSVLVSEEEYSGDVVPTIYTELGYRKLVDYYTTSGAEKYWSVYAYRSDTPQEDIDEYARLLASNEGFSREDAGEGVVWLTKPSAERAGLEVAVTLYLFDDGYELWVGSQNGGN